MTEEEWVWCFKQSGGRHIKTKDEGKGVRLYYYDDPEKQKTVIVRGEVYDVKTGKITSASKCSD